MKYLIYIVVLIMCTYDGIGQNYFSIQTDFFNHGPDRTWQVIPVEEGIITLNSQICLDDLGNPLNQCSSYVLYDYSGNIVSKKLISFMRVQYNAMSYDEISQEISIAGFETGNNVYHLYKCNLNGDSLFHETYEITEAEERQVATNGILRNNNQSILLGYGEYGEDTFEDGRAMAMWINQDGTLDTIIVFDIYQYNSHQAIIDNNGHLTIMYSSFDPDNFFWKKKAGFKKFNENKEIVWEWESPFNFDDGRLPIFDITESNEMIFLFQPDVELFDDESAVGMLSADGEMLWQYEFVTGPYKNMSIFELVVAENGDILGVGTMRDITEETSDGILYETGFAFRLSNTGELLWMRRFRDFNNEGLLKWGTLHAIAEAADGSLVMGGLQRHNIWDNTAQIDAWLIITDENGCIEPDCEDLIILDNRELFFSEAEIQLIQNPVADRLSLSIELDNYEPLNYQIFAAMGQSMQSGIVAQPNGIKEIEVADLASGMYYLYVYSQEKRKTFKFIKN